LNTLLQNIPVHPLEIHSELRPWIKNGNEILRGDQWVNLERARVNYAAKVDLAITDPEYFKDAYEKIRKIQGLGDRLKYWRILLYPLKAFHAIFEIKVRVSGNKRRIVDDLNKLSLLYCRNKTCKYYLIVLDRAATNKQMLSIKNEALKHPHIKFILANKCDPISNITLENASL